MKTFPDFINENDSRSRYSFEYSGKPIYDGWFNEPDVRTFSQGIATGLRAKGVKHPSVEVFVWDGESKKHYSTQN